MARTYIRCGSTLSQRSRLRYDAGRHDGRSTLEYPPIKVITLYYIHSEIAEFPREPPTSD